MRSIIPIICLLIGAAPGFYPGMWKGEVMVLQANTAPAIDPTYANALSDDAVYRSRAPMVVKKLIRSRLALDQSTRYRTVNKTNGSAHMPYVTAPDGVRIHYEVEGSGPPLVLQHGFTDSQMVWYERGYVDALKYSYRLILIDARGHHLSDKPHDEAAYAEDRFAADVVALMDKLKIGRTHYWGYSMGGLIGFALGRDAPERFTTIIPAGASPYPMLPGGNDPMMPMLERGAPGLKAIYGDYITPGFEARLDESDMEAFIACRRQRFRTPGFAASLPKMTMPCLLYAGDADPVFDAVKTTAGSMPNANFFSLPGYGHIQAMMEGHAILPRVMEFLRSSGG
jgi:pimeloyl-ACP methyl ester carboxylesterase